MKKYIRSFAVLLAVLMFMVSAVSCQSMPIKTNKYGQRSVGSVGDFEVSYEELYFLAESYRADLDLAYGDGASTSSELITVKNDKGEDVQIKLSEHYMNELSKRIEKNIVSNYAILSLAESYGIAIDGKEIDKTVQEKIDLMIESDFGGERGEYKDFLKESSLTDSYVRFNLKTDIIYTDLLYKLLENGTIDSKDETVKNTISNEFIRTWHIMILDTDTKRDNLERANEALEKLKSGTSMYEMIGSKYNEDFLNTTTDGYYFTKGIMDKAYEDAAYALEENEISEVVRSIGQDSAGNKVDCYYIIQRLPVENTYVEKNYNTLKNMYCEAELYKMVESVRGNLRFTPNSDYSQLDLLDLERPKQTDMVVVIAVFSVIGGILVSGVVVALYFTIRKRRKTRSITKVERK